MSGGQLTLIQRPFEGLFRQVKTAEPHVARTAFLSQPCAVYADAHQLLASVIADHPQAMVATKTGFFTRAEGEAAAEAGFLTPDEVAVGHSLHSPFIHWQTDRSLSALGRADLVFVHNPERSRLDRADLHGRLREVFAALEEFAAAGRISGYGVATWSGFQHGAFTVPELLDLAKEAAGSGEVGRIGEQIALAEMLQAVGRGWYTELAPLLRRRAEELTGVRPPSPVHSDVRA
ncbi:aldo/keto reductase [Streptomyces adelaidensis]|uniref:aldo/keto reductase n=1 Tax=Streptomyces adelaidensis TaxID=2796465 RepID=UPI0027DDBE0C|nr:aldo/keto reductase [Streptomyces adelaidensis]